MSDEKHRNLKIAEEVLRGFDFEKMHAYMVLTGWEWGKPGQVPNVKQLVATAMSLLLDALDKKSGAGTGGFDVIYHDGEIQLLFTAVESSVEFLNVEEAS